MSGFSQSIESSSDLLGVPQTVATRPNEKKRTRTLKSCLLCRQKKIKCDQLKPSCSSCLKRGAPHLCKYEDPKWNVKTSQKDRDTNKHSDHVQLSQLFAFQNTRNPPNIRAVTTSKDSELIQMNERIRQLEDVVKLSGRFATGIPSDTSASPIINSPSLEHRTNLDYEKIDFYKQLLQISVDFNHGALSWASLLRKDVYLNAISINTVNLKSILTSVENMKNSIVDEDFLKKWNKEDHNAEILFEPESKEKDSLIGQLNHHLKDPKLIWLLVDRFFNSEIYMVLPFVDRDELNMKLLDLIGSKGVSKVSLNFKNKSDLTTIGILLLVMRFASLSSYNCGKGPYNQDADSLYISNNPINKDVMSLVNRIQSEIVAFRVVTVESYQFFILRLSYDYYGPEECDCMKYVSSSSIGQVLQFGVQCGLNRDPDSVPNSLDPKRKNLLRRLWYGVVFLDSYQLMSVGCPPIVDSKFYDTQFPHLNESANDLEYTANEWSFEHAKLFEVCYPLLISILNVRTQTTVSEVKTLLRPILAYSEKLKTIEEIVNSPRDHLIERCNKIKDITILVDCNSLLYMIYYNLFLFYNEHNGKEESLNYFIQIVRISAALFESILFLEPKATEYDLEKHFGNGSIVLPKIEMALHKISQLLFGTLSRIKSLKAFSSGLSPEIAKVVDDIANIARQSQIRIMIRFFKISEIYYHPWVASKAHSFILKNLLNIDEGTYFTPTVPGDYQFIKSFYKSRALDQMFHLFTLEDLESIKSEFLKFDKIMCKYDTETLDQSPFNNEFNIEVEKRWIDQIINDYTNINTGVNANTSTFYDIPNLSSDMNLSFNNNLPYQMSSADGSSLASDTGAANVLSTGQFGISKQKYEEPNGIQSYLSAEESNKHRQSDQVIVNDQFIDRLFSTPGANDANLF